MQVATTCGACVRRAAASAVLIVALVAPASAQAAPTLAFDRACYPEGAPMGFSGSGYSPGGEVTMTIASNGRTGSFTATAEPTGTLNGAAAAPELGDFGSRGPRALFIATARDETRSGQGAAPAEQLAVTNVLVSRWDVSVAPWDRRGFAKPRAKTTVAALGWGLYGTTLYAHYRRAGKTVRSVRVGALTGRCGDLTKRMRQFPFRPVRAGTYRVVFSTSRLYDPGAAGIVYRAVKVRAKDAVR